MNLAKRAFREIKEAVCECNWYVRKEDEMTQNTHDYHISDIDIEKDLFSDEPEFVNCFDAIEEALDKHEELKSNIRELFKNFGLEITDRGITYKYLVSNKENIELLRKIMEEIEE